MSKTCKNKFFLGTMIGFLWLFPSQITEGKEDNVNYFSGDLNQFYLSDETQDLMNNIPSVSQLQDVEPTDWSYQALKSLVEHYGCIVGYPDNIYRGNRAISRFEFASSLKSCLDSIEQLKQQSLREDDLVSIKRLQGDFSAELKLLDSEITNLEAQTTELETNQFSPTVKLNGSAIFAISDAFADGFDNQTIAQYRYRWLLNSSFTGKDKLLIALYGGNALGDGFDTGGFSLPGITVTDPTGSISEKISTQEGGVTSTIGATTNNRLLMLATGYSFPVGDRLTVNVGVGRVPYYFYTPIITGLYTSDEGTGAIGAFGRHDPIYLLVGGGSGTVINYNMTDSLKLSLGYLADGGTVANPTDGNGLFNGGYGVLGQLDWKPLDRLSFALVFAHNYAKGGKFGFNNNGLASVGTAMTNTLAGQDLRNGESYGIEQDGVVTNGYSFQFAWQPSDKFILNGWFGTYYPRLIGRGKGNILTYALSFGFPDLGKEGNLLGIVVGAEPYLTKMGGNSQPFKVDVPLHIEAFYRYQFNDNISITPGLIWLTTPNQDNDNPDAVITTLRTTFSF